MILDVLFERAGQLALEHHTPEKVYRLASIAVGDEPAEPSLAEAFEQLRTRPGAQRRARAASIATCPPSRTRRWRSSPRWTSTSPPSGAAAYTCPMHPEVVSEEPGRCPSCGMKLMAMAAHVHVPDAPRGRLRRARPLPELRHEAAARPRRPGGRPPRARARRARATAEHGHARPRPRGHGRDRVGGRHGRGQQDHDAGEHPLEADRPLDRRREPRHRLAVPRRRPGEDPPGQRDGLRPPDAPPVPHPRRRALPRPRPRRRGRAEPRVERHGARAHRRDGRHPARGHQPRPLDGALPHRRAPRERHDVQLRRRRGGGAS